MTDIADASDTRRRGASTSVSYVQVFRASPISRIAMSKAGISAVEAKRIIAGLKFAQGLAFSGLNLSAATVNRKAAKNEMLSPSESVIGVARLMGQLEMMIEESGRAADFDVADWLSRWLREPLPALGGGCPLDLLDTMEGQALVSHALAQIQSGAYG